MVDARRDAPRYGAPRLVLLRRGPLVAGGQLVAAYVCRGHIGDGVVVLPVDCLPDRRPVRRAREIGKGICVDSIRYMVADLQWLHPYNEEPLRQ